MVKSHHIVRTLRKHRLGLSKGPNDVGPTRFPKRSDDRVALWEALEMGVTHRGTNEVGARDGSSRQRADGRGRWGRRANEGVLSESRMEGRDHLRGWPVKKEKPAKMM